MNYLEIHELYLKYIQTLTNVMQCINHWYHIIHLLEMVANVDDKLGEIFLEDKLPTTEELMV